MKKRDKEKTKGKRRRLVSVRKLWMWLIMAISLLMPKDGIWDLVYAGEFGGFDVDIGTDEGIFDNWENEPEMEGPEVEEPETKKPEADQELLIPGQEEGNGSKEENEEKPDNNRTENIQEKTENRPDTTNRDTGEDSNSNFPEHNDSVDQSSSENGENTQDNTPPKSKSANREKNTPVQKKTKKTKIKITEPPKEEPLKFTAAGTAFTAAGMTKISPKPQKPNDNDENTEKNEKIEENDNKIIEFKHIKTVPAKEYPEIRMIRSTEEMDITILSLRLNGEEVFWHQQGDKLIFDRPVTEKKNSVKLLAIIDGSRIVQMPVWEF